MPIWPQSTYQVSTIVSGFPACDVCGDEAERFVQVQWGLGHLSDHPVCAAHLRQYRVDFDALAPELRRLAAKTRSEVDL